ncbi:hypothetical protein EW145_g110 [Phellinidium pouzarii]|uniref:Dynein light intermediate chain n=1 Tax=Phellinidium pouzarii TaxID=167371 RepID=A0A4S4LJM1_9AGAM|nr:hypothetical protein EW145_g110 [Phellinidium pouzarii]
MDDLRSTSPEEPPQDLWSSILDSVSSSRSIPSKQVILLGEPSSGKSTIAAALLQKPPVEEKDEQHDFAIGYDWADVHDEADEGNVRSSAGTQVLSSFSRSLADTLSRLSVYTVPSSAHAHLVLLPHFVPPRAALPHTAVIIVLDWTKPWTFIEQLQLWLNWVEVWVKGDGSRELEVAREENRERLQSHIQHYSEPTSDSVPTTSTLSGTLLPLGPGTLTHNFSGVPIIVVCTKADLIDESSDPANGASGMGGMVKGKGSEWEEQTDGIMQVLRVICLKYGAALFYTTQTPSVLHHLRQYALHMLFVPPTPSLGMPTAEPVAPHRNPFPFVEKPNILDRDRILVPAGWDSWGKISVLRDGFDSKLWGEAWDHDLEAGVDLEEVRGSEPGVRMLYANLVPDRGIKSHPLPPFNEPMPEQAFLARNYDENAKKGDRDPRAAFKNQNEMPGQIASGIVGPMGSISFSLPNVERALTEMEGGFPATTTGDRKVVRRDVPARTNTLAGPGLGQSTPAVWAEPARGLAKLLPESLELTWRPDCVAVNRTHIYAEWTEWTEWSGSRYITSSHIMGRWTPKHYDEVLVTKIENLVNDINGRCKEEHAEEKTKTLLTYENFVESLDEGDSFTISLVEILVKELADRQSRQSPADKKLITARTSESLQALVGTTGVYLRARVGPAPLSLYDRDPSDSPDDDEFDEFGEENAFGAAEGARIDSALYNMYSRPPPPSMLPGQARPYPPLPATHTRQGDVAAIAGAYRPYDPSTIMQRHLPVPYSPFARSGANVNPHPQRWSSVFAGSSTAGSSTPNATSLVRQAHMRRSSRSRIAPSSANAASDFSDFAARRRSSQRSFAHRDAAESASLHTHAENSLPRRVSDSQPGVPSPSSTAVSPRSSNLPRASLFDPPSPSAQDTGTRPSSPSPSFDTEEAEAHHTARSAPAGTLALQATGSTENLDLPPLPPYPNPSWRTSTLRRGGVPPPESMLPAGASSAESVLASLLRPEPGGETALFEPSFERDFGAWFNNSSDGMTHDAAPALSESGAVEPPVSLPTPRSISPTEEQQ